MVNFKMLLLCLVYALLVLATAALEQNTVLYKDMNGTVHVSSTNIDVPFAINGFGVFQAISAAIRCTQTPCPENHYRTGCEKVMNSGDCTPCSICPAEQYRSGCGGASKGVCVNVTFCGIGEFEVLQPTRFSDRFCAAVICSNGEYEVHPRTTTTSRQCAELSQCDDYEFEAQAPTPTTDRQCASMTPCAVGQFQLHALLKPPIVSVMYVSHA